MTWVWVALGVFVAALLLTAWWFDRDAQRRGARVRSAGEIARTVGRDKRENLREHAVYDQGVAGGPKGGDRLRDLRRGRG